MATPGQNDEACAIVPLRDAPGDRLDAIDERGSPQIASQLDKPPADSFDQGCHAAPRAAHALSIRLQADRGIGEGHGLRARLRRILEEHGDQRSEGGILFQAQQVQQVLDRQDGGRYGQQPARAQDAEVVGQVTGTAQRQTRYTRGGSEQRLSHPFLEPPEPPLSGRRAARGGRKDLDRCIDELYGVGHDIEPAVGQVNAVAGCRHGRNLDAEDVEQVADRLAGLEAHQGGGPGVEREGTAAKIPGAAAELGMRLEQSRPQARPLGQRGRRQPAHAASNHHQVIFPLALSPGRFHRDTFSAGMTHSAAPAMSVGAGRASFMGRRNPSSSFPRAARERGGAFFQSWRSAWTLEKRGQAVSGFGWNALILIRSMSEEFRGRKAVLRSLFFF